MLNTSTRATRATRPLIEYPAVYTRDYCLECGTTHEMELTQGGRKLLCHGADWIAKATADRSHYTRRSGRLRELVPMSNAAQMPLEWQIAAELKEPEYIDVDQEW